MKHIHFYASKMGDAYSIKNLLGEASRYKITWHDVRTKEKQGSGEGADLIITSHLTPGPYPVNKVLHVGHGFGGIGWLKNQDQKAQVQNEKKCQRYLLVYGEYMKKEYAKIGYNDVIVIGMPLSIDLLKHEDVSLKNQFLSDRGLAPDKKTILYAPTWNQEQERGLFVDWWEDGKEKERVEILCNHVVNKHDANFVIRLHESHRYTKNWVSVYKDIFKAYNVYAHHVNDDRYGFPYFRYSDMLIGDLSSVNSYFYLMDKPVIHLGLAPFKTKTLPARGVAWELEDRAGKIISEFQDLLPAIDKASTDDGYREERKRVTTKYIDYTGRACASRILAVIDNLLEHDLNYVD